MIELNKVTISGCVKDETNRPVLGAEIIIDGFNFYTTSKSSGEFIEILSDIKNGTKVTLRVYHNNFKSKEIDTIIDDVEEYFEIFLSK